MSKELVKLSRFISLILRHKPEVVDIELDKEGYALVDKLIEKIKKTGRVIDIEILDKIVRDDSKGRYSFNSDRTKIRANQGHSIKGLNISMEEIIPPEILYHGTAEKSVEGILKNGIEKRSRVHVHLSFDKETAIEVGMRHGEPIVLIVYAKAMYDEGYKFYISENKVCLTDYVPVKFVDNLNLYK